MLNVLSFYKFIEIKDLHKIKLFLKKFLEKKKIKGNITVSLEGINGMISGEKKNLDIFILLIKKKLNINYFDEKNLSISNISPFKEIKIKLKNEVVPINELVGKDYINDNKIDPHDWNKFISDRDVQLIDIRKNFEFEIGNFKNSLNPNVKNFKNFPDFFKKIKNKTSKIALYCTGGIRCEKMSNYLKKRGFTKIYQLKGGILNYLNSVEEKNSLWNGECFVFDQRVTVLHGSKLGSYTICGGCSMPIKKNEKYSYLYEKGVSCSKCFYEKTDEQKKRFRMREKLKNAKEIFAKLW
ncbi:MAG: hypothetical protein FJX30_06150, partial [Alphaproteobacteria bacterium]|nr:hypothetical protein [Alphaproteobacteria bacterium]